CSSKSLANRHRHESPSPARAMPPPAKNSAKVNWVMPVLDSPPISLNHDACVPEHHTAGSPVDGAPALETDAPTWPRDSDPDRFSICSSHFRKCQSVAATL